MIKAFVSGAKKIIGNPFLLLPGLASIAVFMGLLFVFSQFLVDFLVSVVFLEMVPDTGLLAFPFHFTSLYALDLVAIMAFAIISGIVFTTANFFYAAHVKTVIDGNDSIGKAFSETVLALGKIVSLTVFIAALAIAFMAVLWVFVLVLLAVPVAGAVLLALLGLVAVYAYVKLVFVIQALALEKGTVKQAFQQSWELSNKRFVPVLVLVFVLGILNNIIFMVGEVVSELVLNELFGVVIVALAWSVSLSFSATAMALYYSEKKLGH